jgi:hypothetical protein
MRTRSIHRRSARRSAAVTATVLLLAAGVSCGSGESDGPRVVAGVRLAPQDLQLTPFSQVPGTHHLYAALTEQWGFSDYASGQVSSAKDLLFFDATTKGARWLLGDASKKLRSYELIVDPPLVDPWSRLREFPEGSKTLGVLFEVVPDLPDDSDPVPDGQASIGLANADGTAPVALISGVSRLLGSHLLDRDSLVVFYVRGGELWSADVSPSARTVRADAVVSAAPGSPSAPEEALPEK